MLLSHPLLYLLGVSLNEQCIVWHGSMKKIGWSKTYVHFSRDHEYKIQQYTKLSYIMRERGAGLRHISTYPITINTLSTIVKGRVAYLLRPNSTYTIVTLTITSYIVMKTIINTTRINIYTQQYTMVILVMWGLVAGLVHISTSKITINSLFHIAKVRLDGLLRLWYMSYIINTSITRLVTIITTYISSPTTIIATDITPLGSMTNISYLIIFVKIILNRTRIK